MTEPRILNVYVKLELACDECGALYRAMGMAELTHDGRIGNPVVTDDERRSECADCLHKQQEERDRRMKAKHDKRRWASGKID